MKNGDRVRWGQWTGTVLLVRGNVVLIRSNLFSGTIFHAQKENVTRLEDGDNDDKRNEHTLDRS